MEERGELIERLERGVGEEIRILLAEGGIEVQLYRQTPEGEWIPGEERLHIPMALLDRLREILHEA
jgi:hypothetical protein